MKMVHVVGGPHCGDVLEVADAVTVVEFVLPPPQLTRRLDIIPKQKREDPSVEEFFVLWSERSPV